MTTAPSSARPAGFGNVAAFALIPWIAFLLPLGFVLAGAEADDSWLAPDRLIGLALYGLVTVALPSVLPLVVARTAVTHVVVVGVMAASALVAGILLVTIGDERVVDTLVPGTAVVLAAGVCLGDEITARRAAHR